MPSAVVDGIVDMFADDTTVTVCGKNSSEVADKLNVAIDQINRWLEGNRLVLNFDKTNFMILGTKAKSKNSSEITVSVNQSLIKRVKSTKCLGVIIDEELKWTDHVDYVTKVVQSKLAILRRAKPCVPPDVLKTMYNAFVLPHFDYCSQVWSDRYQMHNDKLIKLQKYAARLILSKGINTPSSELFKELGWLPLHQRFFYLKAVFMFKCTHDLAPLYLTSNVTKVSEVHDHNTRGANNLTIPLHKTECYKHSPIIECTRIWNTLGTTIRTAPSMSHFKSLLKTNLLASGF